jgi:hypothetical protein
MTLSRHIASFVIAGGDIEASPPGQRASHADLATALAARLGTEPLGSFVSGELRQSGEHLVAYVGPLGESTSRALAEGLIRTQFRGRSPLEIRFSG